MTSSTPNSSTHESITVKYQNPTTQDIEQVCEIMKKIHLMTTKELRKELELFHIDSHGKRPKIYERLKKYVSKHSPNLLDTPNQSIQKTAKFYDYLIIIDFECTCDEFIPHYQHEIIEFPAVLVSVQERRIIDTFRSFVRPTLNPHLTDFCKELTGIKQEIIDDSLSFMDVLDSFRQWMARHNLGTETSRYAFVTDGPWDIAKFLQIQCIQSNIKLPHDFRHYINLRRCFMNKYRRRKDASKRITLAEMLHELGMEFDGREHCGLDDSRNIARIAVRLLQENVEIRVNEVLTKRRSKEEGPKVDNFNEEEVDISMLRCTLPYKVITVSRESFITGDYLEWTSCSDED